MRAHHHVLMLCAGALVLGCTPAAQPRDAGCTPDCGDRLCGDDGCGGSCGACAEGEDCDQAAGTCLHALCGNDQLDGTETCDPVSDCPTSCDDAVPCTEDRLLGSAANCDVRCAFTPITACAADDGCCPAGCAAADDNDCSPDCGDGDLDPNETCDPPETCPSNCDDADACTEDRLLGAAAQCNVSCAHPVITACRGGDGCCLPQCSHANDSDCPPCGDLASRVVHSDVDVSPHSIRQSAGAYWSPLQPLILSVLASGEARAAWLGSDGMAHVTPLNAALSRQGEDWTVEADELRGFAAHAGGGALLVARGDDMVIVGLDATGATLFETILVGDNDHLTAGDRWIDDWGHYGRLDWDGDQYLAYFGITGNHGAQGNHQGDTLRAVSPEGVNSTWWDWGCSHSLDVRLVHNDGGFGPLCLSDCYPGKGVYFNHYTRVATEDGDCGGSSVAVLGGLVALADGFALTFGGRTDRASRDVAYAFVPSGGAVAEPVWLTDTAGVDEDNVHLAAYGEDLLALWRGEGGMVAQRIDAAGGVLDGPVAIDVAIGAQEDIVNLPGGDPVWATVGASTSTLRLTRIALCE